VVKGVKKPQADELPCKGCGGLCCGPVPVTAQELKEIKRKVKAMPRKFRADLEGQQRFPGTCIFYDVNNDRCGIHSARPAVCRAFGYFGNLVCFRSPQTASKEDFVPQAARVGMLSQDFTWKDFS
jgi:Fe-S-cluster containining protein